MVSGRSNIPFARNGKVVSRKMEKIEKFLQASEPAGGRRVCGGIAVALNA
jgi:hypothetical protein